MEQLCPQVWPHAQTGALQQCGGLAVDGKAAPAQQKGAEGQREGRGAAGEGADSGGNLYQAGQQCGGRGGERVNNRKSRPEQADQNGKEHHIGGDLERGGERLLNRGGQKTAGRQRSLAAGSGL